MDIVRPVNHPLSGHFLELETSCYTNVEVKSIGSIHVSRSTEYNRIETYSPCDKDQHLSGNLNQIQKEDLSLLSIKFDRGNHFSVSEDGGILVVWGCGEFGQHGHGHHNDVLISTGTTNPLLIGQDNLVTLVACGSSHTICVTGMKEL